MSPHPLGRSRSVGGFLDAGPLGLICLQIGVVRTAYFTVLSARCDYQHALCAASTSWNLPAPVGRAKQPAGVRVDPSATLNQSSSALSWASPRLTRSSKPVSTWYGG